MSYAWPIVLIVLSNTFYQICTKSVPEGMNPLASLAVTYLVGALASAGLYYLLNRDANLLREVKQLNWAPLGLGVVIVGLEVGYIYAYRAGWPVSVAPVVQAAILAIVLIFVGFALYGEKITWNKVAGIIICLVGLAFINK